MGAECYGYSTVTLPDCAFCGERRGFMSDSRWRMNPHEMVCSNRCGRRLDMRRRNGLEPWPPLTWEEERMLNLRHRIKQLEHRATAEPEEVEGG